jgi:hypothetical protein
MLAALPDSPEDADRQVLSLPQVCWISFFAPTPDSFHELSVDAADIS